jgi:hypothetical protein
LVCTEHVYVPRVSAVCDSSPVLPLVSSGFACFRVSCGHLVDTPWTPLGPQGVVGGPGARVFRLWQSPPLRRMMESGSEGGSSWHRLLDSPRGWWSPVACGDIVGSPSNPNHFRKG